MSDQETSTDSNTSVSDLRELVREFVEERNWKKFHSPKNLSMALAIEAGELMEHFQWITTAESRELDEEKKAEVGEELADVLCYSLAIANEMGIEIASTLKNKMVKNRQKYPVEEILGRFGHDDPRPISKD